MTTHTIEFHEGDGCCGMSVKGTKLAEGEEVKGEVTWECFDPEKCVPLGWCYECIVHSGQAYYDFFGFGKYKLDRWDE